MPPGNKGRKFHPQALTTPEVEALMAACSPTSPTGKRNRALIVTLWRGALRFGAQQRGDDGPVYQPPAPAGCPGRDAGKRMGTRRMTAGYDDLLPVQQQWFDHLMNQPMNQWPPALREYANQQLAGKALCLDLVADVVGWWVKAQGD